MSKEAKKPRRIDVVAVNRRAGFDYELEARFEAGLVLIGSEVKVLRTGKADLTDGWVSFDGDEAFVRGVNIPVMQGSPYSHEAKRARKLLLSKREIEQLKRGVERDGMTITVTQLYFKGPYAKIEIALARGKKAYDKRQSLKRKEADKEARLAISAARRGER
ncbi:MAG: SsrA-binding protein SmpB [Polyangiaceae bacterium]|nr:SsrA-binding protein SmpB [Polyangiaceae bacterium]